MSTTGVENLSRIPVVLLALLCAMTWDTASTTSFMAAGTGLEGSHKILTDGHVLFGGLFPMHEKGQRQACGRVKKEKGIQRLEAMLYAVKLVNENPDLLPGLTVGVHILDTCSYDSYALEQCMDFIKAQLSTFDLADYRCANGQSPSYRRQRPVVGVIGAASSPVSIMVANILRLFKIPQISYASTSVDLSDRTRFEYFSRVVPPDTYQAQAMVDVARAMGWTYVNTLADDGNYGEKGIGAFEDISKTAGICISKTLQIPRTINETTFQDIVQNLLKDNNEAKVVVMFANEDNCRSFLKAVRKANASGELTVLASDSWGAKIHPVSGLETVAEGVVTILPVRVVIPGFDEYFLSLNLSTHRINPWFPEFWEALFNCTMDTGSKRLKVCSASDSLADPRVGYQQEGLVQFVLDSVLALAHAVHNLLLSRCPKHTHRDLSLCNYSQRIDGHDLLAFIRNVSFIGSGNELVKFDAKGDGQGRYDIFQFQKLRDNHYDYVQVGKWEDKLVLNRSRMRWRHGTVAPASICSEPCAFGQARKKTNACCWVCVTCHDNQYLRNESTCENCADNSRPNANKTECVTLPVLHLEPSSLWFVLPVVFISAGIVATLFVIAVFIRYNSTPLIKASGRELCFLLLLGILLSYGTSFAMLARPSTELCMVRRLGLGVSLAFIYAALFTKTNRIYRIFNSGIKAMVKRPSYTSPRSQILICLCLVSVQVIIGITWLGFEKPSTQHVAQQREFLVLKCRASQVGTICSLSYNICLIVLCTVYAFKTRKIPQNFNEAKYIAFTMYSTCIVWLAFIPIYFTANHDFKIEVTSLSLCVAISPTVALFCLFAPKVYIVLFQPHKNVRQAGSASGSGLGKARSLFVPNPLGPALPLPLPLSLPSGIAAHNGTAPRGGAGGESLPSVDRSPLPDSLEDSSSCDEGITAPDPTSTSQFPSSPYPSPSPINSPFPSCSPHPSPAHNTLPNPSPFPSPFSSPSRSGSKPSIAEENIWPRCESASL